MVGTTKHGAHNSNTYTYYHCSNYNKIHNKEKNINEKLIDNAIQEVLDSFNITDIEIQKVKMQIYTAINDLKIYENQSLENLQKQYKKINNTISNYLKQKFSGELTISETTFNEILKHWELEKNEIDKQIQYVKENSKDRIARMNILSHFANKIPELYLKATLDEKRLILSTIIEKILYDEDSNTLQVKLKPIFEQLRQRKIQNNKTFLVNTNLLTGTLESHSEKAIQADDENQIDLNKIIDYGTHKKHRQHRTGPYNACYKKLNVVGGT